MEKFIKFFAYSLFAVMIVFSSCGGGDDDDDDDDIPDPATEVAELLSAGTWNVDPDAVTQESVAVEDEWDNLTLTIMGDADGGTYATNGSADQIVWKSNGTWEFSNDTGTKVLRDDGIEVDVTVSETSLRLEFTVPEQRTLGIEGRWSFTFVRAN